MCNKKKKETAKEGGDKNETKPIMRSGSRPSGEGTRLVFAGGSVSPIMCPADGQQNDGKKGPTGDKTRRGHIQGANTNSRPQQGEGFR